MTNPITETVPPPLPIRQNTSRRSSGRLLAVLAIAFLVLLLVVALLRIFGLIRVFNVPTGAMTPAIPPGSKIFVEGFSYLSHRPQRGDAVVFKTDSINSPAVPKGQIYVKRVAGLPGEKVHFAFGGLYINGNLTVISNISGKIIYQLPPGASEPPYMDVVVPPDQYYVLGDNSANSMDSRFWGFVPQRDIMGRVALCYWPPERIGVVK